MSLLARITKTLKNNKSEKGVTADRLAKLAKTTKDNVYRRIYDLRSEGFEIVSNVQLVKGQRKTFYRLGA